ncbi:RidA family protein [Burkholderiaceae bacterium UC74_6]
MSDTRATRFAALEQSLGHSFAGEIKIGGNYVSTVRHGDQVFVSGQIPRVGDDVVVKGRVGSQVSLVQAQQAARICTMRALALLAQSLGSLDAIEQVLRITVFVQSAEGFTQQSEVADGATEVLHAILGEAGRPTRTSVGVFQLPKNAAVEIDFIVAAAPG